ncbi:type I-E CRISPR-associated protein Cse1/CasA [Haloechinothrix sp. YIM 98757]|uniref:Type I-E CRISPR-associated protein Cse1/CasA n=1 Tax=Haloechinothrix aidingensis TaxID=2752311 RepID=A0A838AD79_9PSEU|nr:type I-E CRISPR-associated protein Cse1/CasA [Haloechinothrix aidingensis]MBA0127239.1 type I-E CRISPR-associated protein Cse1/CasA [Haloechinothrix aidingensis]
MPQPSFNVVEQGFCPVRWISPREPSGGTGPDELVSLRALFACAHDIADIRVPLPPAESGLLRILYVLTARITGLDRIVDRDDWLDHRDSVLRAGCFDARAIDAYLDRCAARFELFHTATEWPFLQDPRLLSECRNTKGHPVSSGVNKLVSGRAAGNAFVWQSHTRDADAPPVAAPDALWSMLAVLFYGEPGRCTSRQVGSVSKADTKAAPLRATTSFHPLGRNLFETLLLGLVHEPSTEQDVAPWEAPELPDPLGVPGEPAGIASLLTGRFRHAVLLRPNEDGSAVTDARITWAWRYEHGPARDPYVLYRANRTADEPPSAEHARADRAVWRDLDALLRKTRESGTARTLTRYRPRVFDDVEELEHGSGPIDIGEVAIRAIGFDQDRSQAKNRQYYVASTPPVLDMLEGISADRADRVARVREAAERAGDRLREALRGAWRDVTRSKLDGKARDEGVPWLHRGMAEYWDSAEPVFWQLVRADDRPDGSIRNLFVRRALNAYDRATASRAHALEDIKTLEFNRGRIMRAWHTERKDTADA